VLTAELDAVAAGAVVAIGVAVGGAAVGAGAAAGAQAASAIIAIALRMYAPSEREMFIRIPPIDFERALIFSTPLILRARK
jgi:hypothetical protein